jgi:hypothetical protein
MQIQRGARSKKIRRRQILAAPDLRQHVDDKRSAAEEQPQQKDQMAGGKRRIR